MQTIVKNKIVWIMCVSRDSLLSFSSIAYSCTWKKVILTANKKISDGIVLRCKDKMVFTFFSFFQIICGWGKIENKNKIEIDDRFIYSATSILNKYSYGILFMIEMITVTLYSIVICRNVKSINCFS